MKTFIKTAVAVLTIATASLNKCASINSTESINITLITAIYIFANRPGYGKYKVGLSGNR